jgi:HK97 family phage portal protein
MAGAMSGTDLILPNGELVPVRDRRRLEVRDPRGATIPAQFVSPTLPMVPEWDAAQAFRYGYAMNVVGYRCVQLRANAGSTPPFVVGRRMGDHKTIDESAPLARLLGPPPGGPAPKLSAKKLLRWTHAQRIVAGRFAWEIEVDDRDRPVAFWPLAAGSLRVHPTQSGVEWFRLFEYGPAHDPVRLKPDEVFYGWEPSGNDFRQAESAFQVGRFDLSLINLCDRYGIGFLHNNAVPAAIVTTTAFPDEASRRKFLQNWGNEFAGVDNAGRVALNEVGDDGDGPVGDSIDVKVLGLSTKDARLVETRKEATRELAIALGVPWSKLDASGRTFDNATQEDYDFWENTILPDLIDLQDDINMQLAPRLGDEVGWFDLRGVRALKRPRWSLSGSDVLDAVREGIILPNEVRGEVELEPIDGLDERTPALPPAPTQPPAVEPPDDEDDDEEGEQDPPERDRREHRVPTPEEVEARRTRIWRTADAVVTGLERRWERSWRRLFTRQEQAVIDRLTGKRGRQALGYGPDGRPLEGRAGEPADAEAIFTREFWTAETSQVAVDLYEETVAAGLARLAAAFGVAFDVSAEWVQEFVEARANQLAGQVTATTYEAIQAALNEGVAAGEGVDEIAARVRTVFAQANENRAATIARTEVVSAYNGAASLGAATLPADVVAAQEWIATRDGRTRSAHASVDGQVVPIGAAFEVGGDTLAYPGDPSGRAKNTVNCRCTVAFLTPEEAVEALNRSTPTVEHRSAAVALRLVAAGDFDELRFRRALEGAA